jgi:diguanylate cyclase (GGDEF)-like protein
MRAGLRLVARPAGTVARARWLFALLLLLSLVLSMPAPLAAGRGASAALAGAAVLVLAGSCLFGYFTRGAPLILDVLDALGLMALMLACPEPAAGFGTVFAALWFRSLYISTVRALVRCGLFAAAVAAVLPVWPLVLGHTSATPAGTVLGTIPFMFLVVAVGQQISDGMFGRDHAERRSAVLAQAGSALIGVTDVREVRRLAWASMAEVCAATPGLRVLRVDRVESGGLQVDGATGGFLGLPDLLPAEVLVAVDGSRGEVEVGDATALNVAVGVVCGWEAMSLPGQAGSWLLVGAPRRLPLEGSLAVQGLLNQVVLALRNSEVHGELRLQTKTDALTGLANRTTFHAALGEALDQESTEAVTVLFLDLDDFKDVNDVLGHGAGDSLLRETAERLVAVTRPEDVCARLGGDEFAILLHEAAGDAERVGSRLIDAVRAPVSLGDRTTTVTASVGMATAETGVGLEQLIHRADIAMYAAKANGKGRLQVFDHGLLQGDAAAMLERQLGAAAAADELVVHYQPILGLVDGRCTAVEALVRWQHPERGLLYPGDFIALAESSGAIFTIGASVLRQACADVAVWGRAHPANPLNLHVNVSARQLDDEGFIDLVMRCLRDFSMPAGQLVLEITESVVLDSPVAVGRLKLLADHGVALAIDDFGTGYSALTTLRLLPLDIVKIDMSFVAGALTNPADQAVIEAIVHMANRLQLGTVAEGAERPDQQHYLESAGVDAVQGYMHLRPTAAAAFGSWLDAHLADYTAEQPQHAIPMSLR